MDAETKRFMQAQKRRRKEWETWARAQASIIIRLLQKGERFAQRGRFTKAKRAAWDAMMAIDELDRVWQKMSAEGNTFIKTVPKGWKRWRRLVDQRLAEKQKLA